MNRVAAIQMASGPIVPANLDEADRLIRKAAGDGAGLVVLPENFACMAGQDSDLFAVAERAGEGLIQSTIARLARELKLWIVAGTIPLLGNEPQRLRAASLLFNERGDTVARYDKIHLFDVALPGSEERYQESQTFAAGTEPVVVESPFGRIGMAICYDLRFPELFRALTDRGIDLVVLPAAFTAATGKAHWESLIRARAIENLVPVVAAAQGGFHHSGRETWGHSMVVDGWGGVVGQLPRGNGVVSADLDRERLARIRSQFPVLEHRRIPPA
jgi:predicted amidohydrolase